MTQNYIGFPLTARNSFYSCDRKEEFQTSALNIETLHAAGYKPATQKVKPDEVADATPARFAILTQLKACAYGRVCCHCTISRQLRQKSTRKRDGRSVFGRKENRSCGGTGPWSPARNFSLSHRTLISFSEKDKQSFLSRVSGFKPSHTLQTLSLRLKLRRCSTGTTTAKMQAMALLCALSTILILGKQTKSEVVPADN